MHWRSDGDVYESCESCVFYFFFSPSSPSFKCGSYPLYIEDSIIQKIQHKKHELTIDIRQHLNNRGMNRLFHILSTPQLPIGMHHACIWHHHVFAILHFHVFVWEDEIAFKIYILMIHEPTILKSSWVRTQDSEGWDRPNTSIKYTACNWTSERHRDKRRVYNSIIVLISSEFGYSPDY